MDVFVSNLAVNKVARNKRPYGKSDVFNLGGTTSAGLHFEAGRLTNLTDRNVIVYFTAQFENIPTGWIKVYRMKETISGNGKWKQWDVLYYHAASPNFKNEFGFGLVIESTENLVGVIIEYFFI